jgi:hypothetical protein
MSFVPPVKMHGISGQHTLHYSFYLKFINIPGSSESPQTIVNIVFIEFSMRVFVLLLGLPQ